MWTIEQRVGRLIEIRVASPIVYADPTPSELASSSASPRVTERVPRVLACTDLRRQHLRPEVAEWFIRLMHRDNRSWSATPSSSAKVRCSRCRSSACSGRK